MGGSKKGEHRGNARKRPAKPPGTVPRSTEQYRRAHRTHETPGEIMRAALRKEGRLHLEHEVIERRIMIARVINGPSGAVQDVTPKEALLEGQQYFMQAIRDWTAMIEQWSKLPVTKRTIRDIDMAEREVERLYTVMKDFSRDVAGYIHPKLQATHAVIETGENQSSILQELMDEIDRRERAKPIPIEHKTKLLGGP